MERAIPMLSALPEQQEADLRRAPPKPFFSRWANSIHPQPDGGSAWRQDRAICPRCQGSGGARGGCGRCEGTGWVLASTLPPMGTEQGVTAVEFKQVSAQGADEFIHLHPSRHSSLIPRPPSPNSNICIHCGGGGRVWPNDVCPRCRGCGIEPGAQQLNRKQGGETHEIPCLKASDFMPRTEKLQTRFSTCIHCDGHGRVKRKVCLRCGGSGIDPWGHST